METTARLTAQMMAELLVAHGVRRVVCSPGSRNAPLLVACARQEGLQLTSVLDERVAGFVALGMSLQSGEPVALVCTSGSAVLNYTPAVSEAYYRHAALVVVTADRPASIIGQDDSQTIEQARVFEGITKYAVDIPAEAEQSRKGLWHANRLINEALLAATAAYPGPVHINLRLDAPLGEMRDVDGQQQQRVIRRVAPEGGLSRDESRRLAQRILTARGLLIVAGFMEPDAALTRLLDSRARQDNVAVLIEPGANLQSPRFLPAIDGLLAQPTEPPVPEVVITIGGALVSRRVKEYIRRLPEGVEHWHVSPDRRTIDCFQRLTLQVEMRPTDFFRSIAAAIRRSDKTAPSTFATQWRDIAAARAKAHEQITDQMPWSELRLFNRLVQRIPPTWNVHLSNGTPIRYAGLEDCGRLHRVECNRGVSGIDGCTSTAIGASLVYSGTTLLVSGDLSARYDIGALASGLMNPRFKLLIVNNDGGAIFRFIGSTSAITEREALMAMSGSSPDWCAIAQAFGMAYHEAATEEEFERGFSAFTAESERPAMMVVRVDPEQSNQVLKTYFNLMNQSL